MPFIALSAGRSLVVAGLLLLALAACGRRGALEPPPDASVALPTPTAAAPAKSGARRPERSANPAPDPNVAAIDAVDDDEDPAEAASQAIVPMPSAARNRRSRLPTIPKDPFILDPLL